MSHTFEHKSCREVDLNFLQFGECSNYALSQEFNVKLPFHYNSLNTHQNKKKTNVSVETF